MLNIFEKIQFVVSGLVVLTAIGLYAWQGTPTQSTDVLPSVTTTHTAHGPKAAPASPAKSAVSPEDKALLDRLAKEQNVRAKEIKPDPKEVPRELFDHMTERAANWEPELSKAKSRLLPGADGKSTRLQLLDMDDDFLLKEKFGFENNDIIEFIDGERIDFEKSPLAKHMERWNTIREKLEKGQKITLTVTRGNQPIQIEYSLEKPGN